MKPLEALQLLHREQLPLILSFPVEEEEGYLITGKGIFYFEEVHVGSRATLS